MDLPFYIENRDSFRVCLLYTSVGLVLERQTNPPMKDLIL